MVGHVYILNNGVLASGGIIIMGFLEEYINCLRGKNCLMRWWREVDLFNGFMWECWPAIKHHDIPWICPFIPLHVLENSWLKHLVLPCSSLFFACS